MHILAWIKAISGADEVQARRLASAIALEMGRAGVSRVVELTGMSHLTIDKWIKGTEINGKARGSGRAPFTGRRKKKG